MTSTCELLFKFATHSWPSVRPVLTAVETVNTFADRLDGPSRRPLGRVVCRGEIGVQNWPEKALSCNVFGRRPVQTGNVSPKPSWRAVDDVNCNTTYLLSLFIIRHAKHHLKFIRQFANQPHGESKCWSSADPRFFSNHTFFPTTSLHIYDNSASPVRCSVKLTQEAVFTFYVLIRHLN